MGARLPKYAVAAGLFLFATLPCPVSAIEPSELGARVDELFAAWDRDDRPGAAVAVIRDGEIIHQNGFGMADLERSVPVTTESVFEIGSISKQFTAMCILLLEQDGALSLADDVRTYVPEMPEYERPITLRHLLHHTSGVRDVETLIPLTGMPWVNYCTEDQLLNLIARQKALNFPPGEQFLYSNSGYLLLARVVARVSGRSLRDFAQERIFGPLGMEHTMFWDRPGQLVPNRALAYAPQGDEGYRLEMWNLPFAGPAGVYSTVRDLALWDANFYNNRLGGGVDLIAKMETPGTLANGESCGYGGGLVIRTAGGLPLICHGGAWMGYRADLRRYPEQHMSFVLLTNGSSMDVRPGHIGNLYLADKYVVPARQSIEYEPPAAVALDPAELVRYTGSYWNESNSLIRTIEIRDGKLHYVRESGRATELAAVEAGRFFMVGVQQPRNLEFQGSGETRRMTLVVGDGEPLSFELMPSPADGICAAYAGVYWSDELRRELQVDYGKDGITATWTDQETGAIGRLVRVDDVRVPTFIPVPWDPQDARLRFERDGAGAVVGLRLSCKMVRGVSFERRS